MNEMNINITIKKMDNNIYKLHMMSDELGNGYNSTYQEMDEMTNKQGNFNEWITDNFTSGISSIIEDAYEYFNPTEEK